MKRFFAILFVLILTASLAAAESGIDWGAYTEDQLRQWRTEIDAELVKRQALANSSGTALLEGDISGCHVVLDRIWLTKDYNGTPAVALHYLFSNPTSEEKSFMFAVSTDIYQGGVQLESAIMADGVDTNSSMTKIKDGAMIEVNWAYVLRDTSSPIEINIHEMFGGTPIIGTFAVPQ